MTNGGDHPGLPGSFLATPEPGLESQRLRAVLSSLVSGVLVEDEQRRIVLTNHAFCSLFGMPDPEVVVGMDCSGAAELAAPMFEDPAGFVARIGELLARRERAVGDVLRTVDGRVLERDYIPVFLDDSYRGHLWHYRDVTESRRAAERLAASHARRAGIVEAALDAIVSAGRDGRVIEWNPAAERLFGWSRAEALGQPLTALMIPEAMHEAHQAGMERYAGTGERRVMGRRVELTARHKDGTLFPCELSLVEEQTEQGIIVTAFLRDIRDRIAARELLERDNARLAASSLAKSRVMSMVSHDVRTPLQAILMRLEMAELYDVDLGAGAEQHIRRNVRQVVELLEELMVEARTEAVQPRRPAARTEVAEVLRGVVASARPRAVQQGLDLQVELVGDDLGSVADGVSLRRVVQNLVENALKYTPEGWIRVRAECPDGTPSVLRVVVEDSGPGIPADARERIFESWHQEDEAKAGVGLGLSIVRELVDRLHGTIRVLDAPGACFELVVPLSKGLQTPGTVVLMSADEALCDRVSEAWPSPDVAIALAPDAARALAACSVTSGLTGVAVDLCAGSQAMRLLRSVREVYPQVRIIGLADEGTRASVLELVDVVVDRSLPELREELETHALRFSELGPRD